MAKIAAPKDLYTTAYKLIRKRKDGSFGPLFINRKLKIYKNEWVKAECHPTKGYKIRQGFHCTAKPEAPHLTIKNRVWVEVLINKFTELKRPEAQGGLWFLADEMKIVGEI